MISHRRLAPVALSEHRGAHRPEGYETAPIPGSAEYLTDTIARRDEIKNRFRRIMLE